MENKLDLYTVYDNATNTVVKEGSYAEVEDYIDNPKYSVVYNRNGMIL